jgi:hypothetical protein
VLALASAVVAHADRLQPPEGRKIRVAVVLTEGAVVIDFAGPWEVFENVHAGGGDMDQQMPFELYTVGAVSVALRVFKDADEHAREGLFTAQLMARLTALQWAKEGKLVPALLGAFEQTLCELYKPSASEQRRS